MRMVIAGMCVFHMLCIAGCNAPGPRKEIVARVNDYELTRDEFEEEFRDSSYGRVDSPESRKECLNMIINRKLILQDAEAKNLDKEKGFLKMIERFWEQSLLKVAMDKKAREIEASVTEEQVKEYYQKAFKEGKTARPYEEVRVQMRKELLSLKNWQGMNDWLDVLRSKAAVTVNKEALERK